jgi:hypothetical protein
VTGIFVSYRREDSAGWGGRLVADLRRAFPRDPVFFDLVTVRPGEDFVDAVERAIASCSVVLVLIGPKWLATTESMGRPRIHDPDDLVRREVTAALRRPTLTVIPVLVGESRIPVAAELPEEVAPLVRLNALHLSDSRWEYDFARLAARLREVPGMAPPRRRHVWAPAVIGLVVAAAVAVAWRLGWLTREAPRPIEAAAVSSPSPKPEPIPPPSLAPPSQEPSPGKDSPATPKGETVKSAPVPKPASGPRDRPPPPTPAGTLSGLWASEEFRPDEHSDRSQQEFFEMEQRGDSILGTNWTVTWDSSRPKSRSQKFALLDGRLEGERVKFCIQLPMDGSQIKDCYDGIVKADRIEFVMTRNIGHPSQSPFNVRFSARRQ